MSMAKLSLSEETRENLIISELRTIFGRLFGMEASEIVVDTPFLELGADSLFLLQASHAIQEKFGVRVPFRMLLDECPTIETLAVHVERGLPAGFTLSSPKPQTEISHVNQVVPVPSQQTVNVQPVSHQVAVPIQQPVAVLPKLLESTPLYEQSNQPKSNDDHTLETIVREQLLLMSQQLELLSGESARAVAVAQPVIAPSPTPAEPLPQPANTQVAMQPEKASEESAATDADNRIEPEVFVPYQPVRLGGQPGLSARQQQHLDELIERLSRRTRRSKELMGNYRAVLADNRATAGFRQLWKEMFYPLAIERGIGSRVWDVDGNEYVDLTTGFGALIFGHTPHFVTEALQAQIEKGIQLGWQSPLAGEAARLISELTGVERVAFCNSGTEAVMSALRLARTRTGRTKLALFENSYHGTFDGVLVKRGEMDAEGTMRAVPVAPGVPLHMIENVMVLKYGSAESLEILRGCAHELAAVLIEPLQSRRPDVQPKEFLHELRKITAKAGAALIFDEVVCGFRFHPGGAQALFDVQADLVTYGKAVGAGLPIGVVAGKAEYMDAIDGGRWNYGDGSYPEAITTYFAGTYFKNPLVMSAVWASLNHFKNSGPQLQEQLEQRTASLADRLNQYFEQNDVPIRANRFGSLFRFVFRRDLKYKELFFYYLLEKGVYICETRNCFLSTAHTEQDVEDVVKAVQYAVAKMRAGEFLPGGPTGSPDDKVQKDLTALGAKDDEQTTSQAASKVPLTEAQKQLWVLAQMGEEVSVAYNLSLTLELHGTFNLPAMRHAVQTVVNRHEALRMTFSPEGDFQRVSPELSLEIPFEDFTTLRPELREPAAKDWLASEVKKPFDLVQGPLVRVGIGRLDERHHLFVFAAHHIVTDGVSLGIIVRELKALYTAQCRNTVCQLPSPAPFSDFAAWQARMQQGPAMQEAEAYWLEKLAGEVPVLDLPADRPRPAVQTFAGARHRMTIDASLGERLKQLSAEHNSTLFMTLLTAFTVLLYRLTGQDDVIIGVPAAGQISMGQRNLVGYCINLLPLRTRLSATQSFKDCLTSVKPTVMDAHEYQNYPFNHLVKRLNIPRDPSRSPLVSVCFNLDHGSRKLKFYELEDQIVGNSTGTAQFEIDLNITELDGQLHFESDYSTDLFDESTINRWMGHFKTLLESIATDFEQPISEVPLLMAAEVQQLLVDWNNTRADFPLGECFHTLFEAQVERTPEATAVTFEGRLLKYRELNARANQLAHYLQKVGVGTETLVGICMDRTPEMLVAILAVFKAGGAYVPLDRNYPKERLAFILDDTDAVVLLTEQSVLPDLPESRPHVFCMDSDWELVAAESAENLPNTAKPQNLCYVIYTSGSTGIPKGAMVEHKGMLNHLFAKIADLQLDVEDIVAQTASHCFDISVWQFLAALLTGGRVHICNDEVTHNPALLIETVASENISILEVVPSVLRGTLADMEISGRKPEWPFLRWVLVTGEAVAPQLCRQWLAIYPEKPLLNAYGPTECSDDVTHHPIVEPPSESLVTMPIGRPVANMQMYVLDRKLQPVPVGVAGELFIGGIGVGRGYVKLARRTTESFIPNPFVPDEGARLYRSGDLVRYLPDGTIEFLGRVDHQVKVRGFRIELGEIEVVLEEHPAVRQAVVLVREDTPGDKRLVAYLAAEQNVALAELRAHIKQKLPDYMVPAVFVVLDELPLTSNGKIDRRALPAPDLERLGVEEDFIAPRNAVEQTLAEIWAQVLGVAKVGVNDNFFELGGDSILSIQIIARAGRQGLRLNPRQVFQYQTIAELAAVVDTGPIIRGEEGLVTGPVPLTPVQHWFFEQNLANQHHWNQSVLVAVPHDLDARRLENAFQHALAHHDALRLRYTQLGTTWQQTNAVLDEPLRLVTFDFSTLSDAEAKTAIAAKSTELQASLNLTWGPLVRPALFYRGYEREARLLIVVHHLAMDVISWQILLESLSMVYDQLGRGEVVQLPAKTTSFKQWAERLSDYAQSEEVAQQLDYWANERRRHVQPLPVDYQAGSNSEASARRIIAKLNNEETRALLQDVPKTYRTLINDVLLMALAQAFAAWTGERSMLVDVEGHGREAIFDDIDLSRTVGWFTSIAPVLLELGKPGETSEELQRIKEQVREIPNGGIGYGLLRYLSEDAGIRERLSALPQSEVIFNYVGRMQHGDSADESPAWRKMAEPRGPSHSETAKRKYLFEINGGIFDGCLQMVWTYSENVHARETVEALVDGFTGALRRLIEHRPSNTPDNIATAVSDAAKPDQQDLEAIEATYELSPMQQGMLFHTLYEPASRAYFRHLRWTFRNLDVPVFKRAWHEVVVRHAILRTFFTWEQSPTPLQAVRKRVNLTWNELDWRGLSEAEQSEQLRSFLRADQELGFDLSTAPLMRLTLIRLSDDVHEFVWSHHHLLLDGWTLPILRKEVFAFYEAFRQGQELHLENPRPYRDYIAWLQQQDLKEAERFWRETLRGFHSPTPLPIERRNAAAAEQLAPAYDEAHVRLSAETTAALRTLSRQQHVTLNSVMQSVWAVLLAHYSGTDDVVFGAVVAGRPAELTGVESMVGPFINTLPVRVGVNWQAEVWKWFGEVQAAQMEARQYEYSPLMQVQGWSEVERGVALFESILAFENFPINTSMKKSEASLELLRVNSSESVNYPLGVMASPGAEFLIGIYYDSRRFDAATIERLLGHLKVMLESIAANPQQRVSEIPVLTAEECRQLLFEWNEVSNAIPSDVCVHQLFEAEVERTPDAVALVFEDRQMSYGELNRRANQLARHLRRLGVGPDVPVGICVERSPEMVVGLLGILKAGGTYLPLDPQLPKERLEFMLDDANARVLLVQQHLLELLPHNGRTVACLDTHREAIAAEDTQNLSCNTTAEHLAYVCYTSGSTGLPKGSMIPHRSVPGFIFNVDYVKFDASQTSLQYSSISWDALTLELWPALLRGGRCVLYPGWVPAPSEVGRIIESNEVNILWMTSSLFNAVIDSMPEILRGVRQLMIGGEALSETHVRKALELLPETRIVNGYGPSECTVFACCYPIPRPLPEEIKTLPIGKQVGDRRVYLLDRWMNPVPVGVAGELYIGGPSVARGYLNRAELTAEKFVPDPFAVDAGSRLYRSGDLARYLPDGNLEFAGRIDHQVKVRGFRIELGEIEAVLGELPSVRECAVLAREDVPGDKRLVAYVIPSPDANATSNELRSYLSARLPEYMIPQHWVMLESLPLTATGKVDRLALPAPSEPSQNEESYVAPRNSVERLLVEVWEAVFGLQRVGVHDNFFELGGDSIRSIQVIARANRKGLRLSPKLLFQHQTIAELAKEFETSSEPFMSQLDYSLAEKRHQVQELPVAGASSKDVHKGFTPSDFPYARVNQKDLNLLIDSMSRASESKTQ